MAGSRTLKLSILADVDDLRKKLDQSSTEVQTFGDKVSKFGKLAGAAFLAAGVAAGAYASKLAIDGVKAAIEDEAAQVKLAGALERATGATNAQIKATEDQILKLSLATGVSDNNLRPALSRLAVATGDVNKAQDLLTTALDIAAQTGKPLETVSNALGKAYEGNTAALGKLGIGLSSAELKTMSFQDVQGKLTDLFGGAAAANAQTYEGRIARLRVAFDEGKEAIGARLLPIIEDLVDLVVNKVVPNLGKFAEMFKPITDAIVRNKETFKDFGKFLVDYVVPVLVVTLGGALKVVGKIAGGIIDIIGGVISAITNAVNAAISAINKVIEAYNKIPFLPDLPTLGGSQKTSTSSSKSADAARAGAGAVNITINGAIDPAGTARQIAGLLKNEASTSGSFNTLGLSTFG
jgi:phage-related protein